MIRPEVGSPAAGSELGRPAAAGAALDRPARSWRDVAADYLNLTKPRITLLNLITAFAALWLAARGRPEPATAAAAMVGTALSVASGAVLNCWVERERDGLMSRTSHRPLPAGRLPAQGALWFGVALGLVGVPVLWRWTTPLAAAIAAFGIVFYAGVYTALLKTRTHRNTELGAIAGAVPPLIGWTAVTGRLDLGALLVAGVVFAWQPVHFWALALKYTDDYRRAGIKMLPVTHGDRVTRRQILIWTVLMIAVSVALYPMGLGGVVYLAVAAAGGAVMLATAVQTLREEGTSAAWRLFHWSNLYLGVLYLLMIIDDGF
ncbi:MAG: heme o synthase [Thermaerobacter sp.]|nr:protoheme IX farnesyltransferase [Bacillota bacterium]